jgi:hypothetical protein
MGVRRHISEKLSSIKFNENPLSGSLVVSYEHRQFRSYERCIFVSFIVECAKIRFLSHE